MVIPPGGVDDEFPHLRRRSRRAWARELPDQGRIGSGRHLAAHRDLAGDAEIALCQNGWGNAEYFCACFPEEQVYNLRVTTGFWRPEENHTQVTVHAEAIHIGGLFHDKLSSLRPSARAISAGDIPCRVTHAIEKDL